MGAAILVCLLAQPAAQETFESRWQAANITNFGADGRDAELAVLEKILADYPQHERRAEVMIRLSSLYEAFAPPHEHWNDPAVANRWLREAINGAPAYS